MIRRLALTLAPVLLPTLLGCTRPPAPPPVPAPTPSIVDHRVAIPWLPTSVGRFAPLLDAASVRHGVDADLLAIVVLVESGGDPAAVSPSGALGLMQIMPATGSDIAERRGIAGHVDQHLYDPAYNIDFGAWYLGNQVRRFWTGQASQTVDLAAAAYNGGPGRVGRHLDSGEPLPAETERYRQWVGGMWRERYLPTSQTFAAWWQAGGSRLVTGKLAQR